MPCRSWMPIYVLLLSIRCFISSTANVNNVAVVSCMNKTWKNGDGWESIAPDTVMLQKPLKFLREHNPSISKKLMHEHALHLKQQVDDEDSSWLFGAEFLLREDVTVYRNEGIFSILLMNHTGWTSEKLAFKHVIQQHVSLQVSTHVSCGVPTLLRRFPFSDSKKSAMGVELVNDASKKVIRMEQRHDDYLGDERLYYHLSMNYSHHDTEPGSWDLVSLAPTISLPQSRRTKTTQANETSGDLVAKSFCNGLDIHEQSRILYFASPSTRHRVCGELTGVHTGTKLAWNESIPFTRFHSTAFTRMWMSALSYMVGIIFNVV